MMRDEVEDVFFKICARTANGMHFVLANHLGEGKPEFSGAHCARDRNQHFTAFLKVSRIALCGVLESCRVECR